MPSFEGSIEIDPATNPIVVAHRILEERVKELSQELPGVTFGYIGNLERWGMIARGLSSFPTPLVSAASTTRSASAPRRNFQPPSTSGPRSLSQPASVITTAAGERDVPACLSLPTEAAPRLTREDA
jgi:hypothetical protein